MAPRRHRRRRLFAAAAGVASALALAASIPAVGTTAPPPGAITNLGRVDNYFYKQLGPQNPASVNTGGFGDPANHLFFETNGSTGQSSCANLVAFDSDTYKQVATDAREVNGQCAATIAPSGSFDVRTDLVTDSTDGLILGSDIAPLANQNPPGSTNQVGIVRERTLDHVLDFTLPAVPVTTPSPGGVPGLPGPTSTASPLSASIVGNSWDAARDELLVTADVHNSFVAGRAPIGVQVVAFDIARTLASGSPVVAWNTFFTQCQEGLQPAFSSAAAVLATGEAALYLPCTLSGYAGSAGSDNGVVKAPLGTSGCNGSSTTCPNPAAAVTTPMPGAANDAYFDPGSDRIFFASSTGTELDALAYDGHSATFLGKSNVGTKGDVNASAFALDGTTGRFYAVGPASGLTLVDGRRTPLSPGSVYPDLKVAEYPNTFTVFPPDSAHPFTRLFINDDVDHDPSQASSGTMPDFLVYADTVGVSVNPSANSVDANANSGTVGANARGYAFHSVLVGNYTGSVHNAPAPQLVQGYPYGNGNDDSLGGVVQQLQLQESNTLASASAMADGNGTLSYNTSQCTGVQSATTCGPPPPVQPSLSGAPATAQGWPFPNAGCSEPGGSQAASVNGVSANAPSASGPQQQQQVQPGTLTASVDCSKLTAAADVSGWDSTPQALPTVSVDQGDTQSSITLPSGSAGVTTSTTADAKGIHINLSVAGAGFEIFIGSVTQQATTVAAGVAGSAHLTDEVTVSQVVVNGTELCSAGGSCAAAIQAINSQFPAYVHIDMAGASYSGDSSYARSCTSTQSGPSTRWDCAGSPGGYIASVDADLVEQYGDQQFNGMSPEESSFKPGLRIVTYGYEDGQPDLTRQVTDLAGVEDDSEMGVQAPTLFAVAPAPPSITSACAAAGCTPQQLVNSVGAGAPSAGATLPPGNGSLLQRLFDGLAWLLRTPLAALQMFALLSLLGLPIMMMRRRWSRSATGGGAI